MKAIYQKLYYLFIWLGWLECSSWAYQKLIGKQLNKEL